MRGEVSKVFYGKTSCSEFLEVIEIVQYYTIDFQANIPKQVYTQLILQNMKSNISPSKSIDLPNY